jgi:hypothetical protein
MNSKIFSHDSNCDEISNLSDLLTAAGVAVFTAQIYLVLYETIIDHLEF